MSGPEYFAEIAEKLFERCASYMEIPLLMDPVVEAIAADDGDRLHLIIQELLYDILAEVDPLWICDLGSLDRADLAELAEEELRAVPPHCSS